jgi:hypothetical protein
MTRTSRNSGRHRTLAIALLLALASLISMTGCSRRYVVVDAGKPANVTQGEVDQLHQDNELLLKALEDCRGGK